MLTFVASITPRAASLRRPVCVHCGLTHGVPRNRYSRITSEDVDVIETASIRCYGRMLGRMTGTACLLDNGTRGRRRRRRYCSRRLC